MKPAIFFRESVNSQLSMTVDEDLRTVEPPTLKPTVELANWSMRQVIDEFGRVSTHLIGRDTATDEGFVSSEVVSFTAMTALTKSGRMYRLKGSRGSSPVSDAVWSRYKKHCGLTEVIIGD